MRGVFLSVTVQEGGIIEIRMHLVECRHDLRIKLDPGALVYDGICLIMRHCLFVGPL